MSVTISRGAVTYTFRSGSLQVQPPSREPQQIRSESEDLTVRITTVSTNRKQMLHVDVQSLQKADEGTFHGYDSLVGLIENTLDYSANTCILTDADGDSYACRFWEPVVFELWESPKGVHSGEILFRREV